MQIVMYVMALLALAKLPKKIAKAVDEAESIAFEALAPGVYSGRLKDVKTDGKGAAGPYWTWEFDELQDADGDKVSGRLWVNTSLSENALWKLKEVFSAFGESPDTDTDELIGHRVRLVVSQRVIEKGARKGDMGNNVDQVLSLDSDAVADDDDDEDLF